MTGILAVWNDCDPKIAAEYEHWYMTEHIPERLAVDGFRSARRYLALAADREFFTFYEVDTPAVLTSPAYVARLSSPTATTQKIMPKFHGMVRSVLEETRRDGVGAGGACVVVRYADGAAPDLPAEAMAKVDAAEIIGARVWQTAPGNGPLDNAESRTRPQRDASASAAIVIETARAESAQRIAAALTRQGVANGTVGCYRLLCALTKQA